jgi:hypothetical protein
MACMVVHLALRLLLSDKYLDVDFLKIKKSVPVVAFLPYRLTLLPKHVYFLRTIRES